MIKMLGDLGEILHVEDLGQCSFHPLRNLARMTMPEEHFHSEFGKNFCTDICETKGGKETIQKAINDIFPHLPSFFGRTGSRNNKIYRKWGLKKRSNEDMREDFVERAKKIVGELNLILPEVDLSTYDK